MRNTQEQEYLNELLYIERHNAATEKLATIDEEVVSFYRGVQAFLDQSSELFLQSERSSHSERSPQPELPPLPADREIDERFRAWSEPLPADAGNTSGRIAVLSDQGELPEELSAWLDQLGQFGLQVTVLGRGEQTESMPAESAQASKFRAVRLRENDKLERAIPAGTDIVLCTALGQVVGAFEQEKGTILYWVSPDDLYLTDEVFLAAVQKLPLALVGKAGLFSQEREPKLRELFFGRAIWEVASAAELAEGIRYLVKLPPIPCTTHLQSQKLSLCMIVKDEAENLRRCLPEAETFADEIIVVDTGSQDDTPQVARSFGAKVSDMVWEGDFAAARNESLRRATGDWILVLDADEVLLAEQGLALKRFIRRALGNVYQVNIYNVATSAYTSLVNQMVRLFRNDRGYRYEGTIHEQLVGTGSPIANILESEMLIYHYGYLPEQYGRKGKGSRNLQILEDYLADHPDDHFYLFNYGMQLMAQQRWEEALHYFQESFRKAGGIRIHHPLLLNFMAACLMTLKRYPEAKHVLKDAAAVYPLYPDFYYLQGEIYFGEKRYSRAKKAFQRAMQIGEARGHATSYNGRGSFLNIYFLARIAEAEGKWAEGLALLEKWIPEFTLPQGKQLWSDWAVRYLTEREIGEHLASGFWRTSFNLRELYFFLVGAFMKHFRQAAALNILEQMPDSLKSWDVFYLYRGWVEFREEHFDLAWEFWGQIQNLVNEKVGLLLGFAHWVEGRPEMADGLTTKVRAFFTGQSLAEDEGDFFLREALLYRQVDLETVIWSYPQSEVLANIFAELEQPELELRALGLGLERGKLFAEGYVRLGDLCAQQGIGEDAENFWLASLKVKPDDWSVYTRLLRYYRRTGEKEKIRQLLRQSQEVFGKD